MRKYLGKDRQQSYLVSVRQVTTVGKIQGHNPVMWLQESSVDLKVGW